MKRGVLFAVAAIGLLAAFALKEPCTTSDWQDHYQYRNYCYSDIFPLYFARGLADGQVPYLEAFNEYPVVTGMFSYAVARVTDGVQEYMHLTFILLLVAAAWTARSLWRIAGDEAVVWWSLAPPLAIHALTNWDLLAVAMAAGGWWAWRQSQHFTAAFLFGLGGAAKLYPAFFLPFLFFDVLRQELGSAGFKDLPARWRQQVGGLRATGATLAGGTLGFAGPNLAVAAAAPHGWRESWRFHRERHTDFETLWETFVRPAVEPMFPGWGWNDQWHDLVASAGLVILVASTAYLSYRVWKGLDPLLAGGIVVMVFLLSNKVYSPQYTLWVFPLLLLLHAKVRLMVAFLVADLVVFLARYRLFTPAPGQDDWDMSWQSLHAFAVIARWIMLAWLTAELALRHGLGRRPKPGGTTIGDPSLAPQADHSDQEPGPRETPAAA